MSLGVNERPSCEGQLDVFEVLAVQEAWEELARVPVVLQLVSGELEPATQARAFQTGFLSRLSH